MAPLASLWRRLPALVVACVVLVALQAGIAFAKDAAPAPGTVNAKIRIETDIKGAEAVEVGVSVQVPQAAK